jgi:CheY-like chemotaxis protein
MKSRFNTWCGRFSSDAAIGYWRRATAALTLSSDFQDPIHLLLTDIVMPRMNGLEVAKYLAADRPSIKILYMSGYPETVVFEQERLSPGRYFLRKPFLAPTLARKVRQVLNDPSMNGSVSH